MKWNRRAGFVAALTLVLGAGCINDVSNLAPYAPRIGTTFRLTYAGEYDCELWQPKVPGGDYFILPYLPKLDGSKQKGYPLKEGILMKVRQAKHTLPGMKMPSGDDLNRIIVVASQY